MNVPMIGMPAEKARVELRAVRAALHRRADAEYEAIARGMQAVVDGALGIISLAEAIQAGGFDTRGRPKLAVARADRRHVEFSWARRGGGGTLAHFDARRRGYSGGETLVRAVPVARPAGAALDRAGRGFALVPIIPPKVRNAVRFRDRETYILWEVEAWSDTPLESRPDRDPYLLRHLAGDAYAVLAEWDLTEMERMVMAGRRGLA
jgi:hypothetical protein